MNDTKLARAFNWLGDSIEALGPSVYRMLASILPYLTPIPVAWLTMKSAESFLNFNPTISFIFVFGLEGIGLWFTGLFVEAVVDFIKSRNTKTFFMVVIFGMVVAGYVYVLVNLNVILKTAMGDVNPELSRVITLLCFLPLMTGVGNGYYKWKLDSKRQEKLSKEQERLERKEERQEKLTYKREKLLIEHGMVPESSRTFQQVSGNHAKVSNLSTKVSPELSNLVESFQKVSGDWRKLSNELSRPQMEQLANLDPAQMKEIEAVTGYTYKTISNWRASARQRI